MAGLNFTQNFTEMLNEYLPHQLIEDRMKKTNYFWNKIPKDKSWLDGTPYVIPYEFAEASAFQFNGLIESSKITDMMVKRSTINDHAFLSGAMKWHQRDLKRYNTKAGKLSFLKLLPKKVNRFTDRMKYLTNLVLLDKGTIATVTADCTAGGLISVDKPQRFAMGERLILTTTEALVNDVEFYVGKIDMNGKTIEAKDAAGAAIDLSAFDIASGTIRIKIAGYDQNEFFTLVDHLLPQAQGGSDKVNGVLDKADAPILQPQVIDCSGWSKSTIISDLYDFYFEIKELQKVDETEILGDFELFKVVALALQASKEYTGTTEAGIGYKKLKIDGPMGEMTLVALEEMKKGCVYLIDWSNFVFAGDEFFKPMRDMNGNLFTVERVAGGTGADGYVAIQDIALSGQFLMVKGSGNGVGYGISL